MAVASLPQPRVFTGLQLSFISPQSPSDSTLHTAPFNWSPTISATASLTSDRSGKLVDFQYISSDEGGTSNFRCYLQHTQVFKVGPTSQFWMVEDCAPVLNFKAPYSKGVGVSFASEEASNCLFAAVFEWKSAEAVKQELTKVKDAGIIVLVEHCEWLSPMVFALKKQSNKI
ncbi:hypothetical protein L7F22_008889 [Adiantum nelumboides]|nr:hypothetical protein [Adiantum nelumboides]